MTAVVLRPLNDGTASYAVVRGGIDTGAVVWHAVTGGWRIRCPRHPVESRRRWPLISDAVRWLDSPAGQAVLDSLAAEVPR